MVLNTRVSIKADYQQPTAAYNYYMYVFHLPLSAKPVSFSFGSSEGWKLHFKLLDYNFFFWGGGDAPTTHRGNRPYINSGLLHHWQPLNMEKVIEISEIHVGDRNRKSRLID